VSTYRKSFDHPDERVEIAGMVEDVVEIGDFTVGRVVQPPGFRWSEHIRPIVGGEWCAARHVGVVLSGRMHVDFKDGTTVDIGPNDVFDIPPGHDAYVLGDEPLVEIDWSGLETWTGFRVRLHDRVLAGLLMTDIVGSTTQATRAGDAEWRHQLASYYESMRSQLDRFRGREIDTAGDGIFAVFDGAARALECAAAMRKAASGDGLNIRIGIHVGEIELTLKGARGIAVHEVARITSVAGPGEILVSEATRTLSAGSGLTFEDRGTHTLKGIAEARRLYSYGGGVAAPEKPVNREI
jgi:class 3 adenylate cyclase